MPVKVVNFCFYVYVFRENKNFIVDYNVTFFLEKTLSREVLSTVWILLLNPYFSPKVSN